MNYFQVLLNLILVFCYCVCENVIDVDDFLSPDYMPTTLLMLENPTTNKTVKYPNATTVVTGFEGSLDKAFITMGYHRHMMNEYLCRNYIAEQIVQDMSMSKINKRMGVISHGPGMNTLQSTESKSTQTGLLEDEGSSNYKDWLSKSTTLEDIYKHYDMGKRSDVVKEGEVKDDEEFDEQVIGYGYTYQPKPSPSPSKLGHSAEGIYVPSGGGGYPHPHPHPSSSGAGYFGGSSFGGHSGGGSYGGGHHPIIHEQVIHVPKHHHHVKYVDKKEGLTELFEIALTALAFLSFGMFIVHVVMCISMTTNTTTTAMGMMMPTNTGNTESSTSGMDQGGGGELPGGEGDGMMDIAGDMADQNMGDGATGGEDAGGGGDMGDGVDMGEGGDIGGGGDDMGGGGMEVEPEVGDEMGGGETVGDDMEGGDTGGEDMGGEDMGGGDTGGEDMGGEDMGGTEMGGDDAGGEGTGGQDMMTDEMGTDDIGGDNMGGVDMGDNPGDNNEAGSTDTGGDDMADNDAGLDDSGNGDGMTDVDNGDQPVDPEGGSENGMSGGGENENGEGEIGGDGGGISDDNSDIDSERIKDLFFLNGDFRSQLLRKKLLDRLGDTQSNEQRSMLITKNGFYDIKTKKGTGTGTGTATGTGGGGTSTGGTSTGGTSTGGTATGGTSTGGGTATGSRIHDDDGIIVETEEAVEVPVGPAFDGMGSYSNMQYRNRRDVPAAKVVDPNNYALNELARRVLISIEAATLANLDNGVCLRKTLCENNRYSRQLVDTNKIWIPVWSFGMSWLTSRLGIDAQPSTSMLDSLKASILGLGKAKCEILYQNCDLQRRRRKSRKIIRKPSS
ncbi:uncharacterized protein LOC123315988 [Coccinella septempunctata]|uniref:uncharacterized protein LOC123315988 n=1 Tax=Coccinella septempunctata TaxID=41139 RepID=UPI001D078A36|nr:uncharacterized protein LOC123315988 [Coccinella septempunctata]